MKNIAIINATNLSRYVSQPLVDSSTALSRVVQFCRKLPGVEEVVIFSSNHTTVHQGVRQIVNEQWTTTGLLEAMQNVSSGCSHIFYVFADCPFLSEKLAQRMYGNHTGYFTQYAFADGYPYGLTPEILMVEVIPALLKLSAGHPVPFGRTSLFDLIQKDINAFDIETEIPSQDFRLLRVSLTTDTKRNTLLVNRLLEHGAEDEEAVVQTLQQSPFILRTLPGFFNIQIVEGCPQNCVYCPYPTMRNPRIGKHGEMSIENFENILEQIETFCEDAVLSISLWGEPAYHSQIFELICSVLQRDRFGLVIETSGIGWSGEIIQRIKANAPLSGTTSLNLDRSLTWIVSLDAWSEAVYDKLRGEGFVEAVKTAEHLKQLYPEDLYVQAVRMKDNEEDLERFFREWKEKIGSVIIQKYDHFCHALSDERVTDLSPLKRFPCWHNKRDVVILLDGSVPMCREDIKSKSLLGNIWNDGVEEIWSRGLSVYERHIEGNYPSLCKDCDEYYTYNF